MAEIRGMQFPREAAGFSDTDRLVLEYVELVTRASAAIPETFMENLRKQFSEEQIVDLTLATCLANITNRFNDALRVEPDLGVQDFRQRHEIH